MMDPKIGWFQPEHNGPALKLWKRVWHKANSDGISCNHPNHDTNEAYHNRRSGYNYRRAVKNRRENPSSTYNFDHNQHLIRKYGGTPWRSLRDFYDSGITGLHQEIQDFFEYMKPNAEEKAIRIEVYDKIAKIILELWTHSTVKVFGSCGTSTYLPISDIDIVVYATFMGDSPPFSALARKLIEKGICSPSMIRILDRASVPIIKLTDGATLMRINISFNSETVGKSVDFINQLKIRFPNLPKLLAVIKYFILQRDLNEVYTGGISSYALTLMTINFFQLHPHIESNSPNANLGVLLLEFFQLYGQLFNYDRVGLRVKDGGAYMEKTELIKNMDKSIVYRPSLLCIEDPVNPENNVARNSYDFIKVKDAFDYAYDILIRAVGPLRLTVDQTKSILGRVVRVTDEVIDYRNKIVRRQRTKQMEYLRKGNHLNRYLNYRWDHSQRPDENRTGNYKARTAPSWRPRSHSFCRA